MELRKIEIQDKKITRATTLHDNPKENIGILYYYISRSSDMEINWHKPGNRARWWLSRYP